MNACAGCPVSMFVFETDGVVHDRRLGLERRVEACKTICFACTERMSCLRLELEAMKSGATSIGVFGGTTPAERRRLLGVRPHSKASWGN